jgi:hypothetical protein
MNSPSIKRRASTIAWGAPNNALARQSRTRTF